MPIFAYRCDHCGFEKDVLQKRSDPLLTTCPSCGREAFARRLTAPAFQLKGSGWYVTDFRDNGKGASKPAEGGEPAPASAGGEASSTPAASTPASTASTPASATPAPSSTAASPPSSSPAP